MAEKKVNIVGRSAWITIEINDLVNFWVEHPEKNFGLLIHCYNSFGEKFAQNLNEEVSLF